VNINWSHPRILVRAKNKEKLEFIFADSLRGGGPTAPPLLRAAGRSNRLMEAVLPRVAEKLKFQVKSFI
jgi:hypothetical protein